MIINQGMNFTAISYPAGDEVREILEDREGSEDHPVSEPLRVVVLHRALQRLDRAVRGVDEAHNVGQQLKK